MADKTTTTKIRATKEDVFNALKTQFPTLFGTKTFADIEFFGEDDSDPSKLLIEFVEE